MRTIDAATDSSAAVASALAVDGATTGATALIDSIAAELHQMLGSLRCAGTGRMVKAGISMTHLHILWVLEHHGDVTMGRLAELLDVSVSNATGLIDRMAERGLVDRVRVPNDRRVVLVRASAEGARIRDEIEALKQDGLRAILGRLSSAKLERVLGAIVDLRGAAVDEIGTNHLDDHAHHI